MNSSSEPTIGSCTQCIIMESKLTLLGANGRYSCLFVHFAFCRSLEPCWNGMSAIV